MSEGCSCVWEALLVTLLIVTEQGFKHRPAWFQAPDPASLAPAHLSEYFCLASLFSSFYSFIRWTPRSRESWSKGRPIAGFYAETSWHLQSRAKWSHELLLKHLAKFPPPLHKGDPGFILFLLFLHLLWQRKSWLLVWRTSSGLQGDNKVSRVVRISWSWAV